MNELTAKDVYRQRSAKRSQDKAEIRKELVVWLDQAVAELQSAKDQALNRLRLAGYPGGWPKNVPLPGGGREKRIAWYLDRTYDMDGDGGGRRWMMDSRGQFLFLKDVSDDEEHDPMSANKPEFTLVTLEKLRERMLTAFDCDWGAWPLESYVSDTEFDWLIEHVNQLCPEPPARKGFRQWFNWFRRDAS